MEDYDGNDRHCPECGQCDEFRVDGRRWVTATEEGSWELESVDTDGSAYEWSYFDGDDWCVDDINDEEIHYIRCPHCGWTGNELVLEEDVNWDEVKRSQLEKPSSGTRLARKLVDSSVRDTERDKALNDLAERLHKAADMDIALAMDRDNSGYKTYKLGPDYADAGLIEWTPECERLWELGKSLVRAGFQSVAVMNPTSARPPNQGDLVFRLYDVYSVPADNLNELDMTIPCERRILMFSILQDVPMTGIIPVKSFVMMVPWEEAGENDDWDRQVWIAEVSDPDRPGKMMFKNPEEWDADTFEKITWYRTDREKIRETLEVVFDITPGGYIPFNPEAREQAMTSLNRWEEEEVDTSTPTETVSTAT